MSVCPKNACAGGYGSCLDVKLTSACNAGCNFCIEKGGLQPREVPANVMAQAARNDPADTVLILGGEPMIDTDRLVQFLKLLRLPVKLCSDKDDTAKDRTAARKVYLTTNGCFLNEQTARQIAPYLDGVNISLHHYDQIMANVALRLPDDAPNQVNFNCLREAIQVFHTPDENGRRVPVRINANLVKGWLDSPGRVRKFIAFAAKTLQADCVRFTELQHCDSLWVNARTVFPEFAHTVLPADPFTNGCEQELDAHPDIRVIVKMGCGLVCDARKPLDTKSRQDMYDQAPKNRNTRVLYPDGIIRPGWVKDTPKPAAASVPAPAPASGTAEDSGILSAYDCHRALGYKGTPRPDFSDFDCHAPGCH